MSARSFGVSMVALGGGLRVVVVLGLGGVGIRVGSPWSAEVSDLRVG